MLKRILLLSLLSIFVMGIWAESFEIEAYDIAIKAEKDGTLDITETIDVRFLEESHGIYRDIQYRFDNPNGNAFDPIIAEISNVSATSLYEKEKEDGTMRLVLGDPDKYAQERERYTIQYSYHLDYNRTEGYDELYYNIISPAWNVTIKNITWSVSLPSPVERDRIWVTEGKSGGRRAGVFALGRNNTYIEGEKDLLLPNSAITLRVEMDKGYWKGWAVDVDNSKPYVIAGLMIALIFALLSFVFWLEYGKDRRLDTSGLRTTPPSGLNPMDVGFIVDQTSSAEKEGMAMIFKWAEEGRLTVTEKEGKNKKDKSSYTFKKIKDLDDGVKESERLLFDSVFFKDEVTMNELVDHGFQNDFISKVVKAIIKENRDNKEKTSTILQIAFLGLGVVAVIASGILLSCRYPGLLSLLMVICFLLPSFLLVLFLALYSDSGKTWKKNTVIFVFTFVFVVILLGALFVVLITYEAKLSSFTKTAALASFVLFMVGMGFSSLMDKKSNRGNKNLKECIEYRNYLIGLLEGRIQPSEDDKNMWGTHMAYALALGLKTKGQDIQLDMPQPSWYYGPYWNGNLMTYYLLFHSCSSSYSSTVLNSTGSTTPGGGGFSGSGFSGGGFSGGGGGRW